MSDLVKRIQQIRDATFASNKVSEISVLMRNLLTVIMELVEVEIKEYEEQISKLRQMLEIGDCIHCGEPISCTDFTHWKVCPKHPSRTEIKRLEDHIAKLEGQIYSMAYPAGDSIPEARKIMYELINAHGPTRCGHCGHSLVFSGNTHSYMPCGNPDCPSVHAKAWLKAHENTYPQKKVVYVKRIEDGRSGCPFYQLCNENGFSDMSTCHVHHDLEDWHIIYKGIAEVRIVETFKENIYDV